MALAPWTAESLEGCADNGLRHLAGCCAPQVARFASHEFETLATCAAKGRTKRGVLGMKDASVKIAPEFVLQIVIMRMINLRNGLVTEKVSCQQEPRG